jgi:hypothetical protein
MLVNPGRVHRSALARRRLNEPEWDDPNRGRQPYGDVPRREFSPARTTPSSADRLDMAVTPTVPIAAPAQGESPARADTARRVSLLCDALFALATAATASWWFWRLSRGFFFAYDDWSVAARPRTFSDLFHPHNQHLSVVPLLVYRGMLSVFGLESYAPFRLLGVLGIVALASALYLLARTRLGAVPALAIGMCALWLPSTSLTPFLFNYTVPLALAALCCRALPADSRRADILIFAALVFALCTSAVGVAIAAACIAHTALRPTRTRVFAVTVPFAGWILWYFTLGDRGHRSGSTLHAVNLAARGIFGSFEDIGFRSPVLGVVLGAACGALLGWRMLNDRASARLQIAWLVALLVWWSGLAWSRIAFPDFVGTPRYRMVGSVFVLLSLIPSHRVVLRVHLGIQLAAAVALSLAFVAANHADVAAIARNRTTVGTWVKDVVVEMQHVSPAKPDKMYLPVELDAIRASQYQKVLARYGSPLALQPDPDRFEIGNGGLAVRVTRPQTPAASCATEPVTLRNGESVTVQAPHGTTVTARRLGEVAIPVRTLKAGTTATITTWGPSVPGIAWTIAAPNACITA